MDKKARAAHLLSHYFAIMAKASGVRWDSDNDAEIAEAVDAIIDAALEDVTESIVKPEAQR